MKIQPGQIVILIDSNGNKYRVEAAERTEKVKGLGVINLGKLLKMEYGERVTFAGTEVVALQGTTLDHLETMERKAQIVLPKDAAYIILHCNIRSRSVVVEGGSGSGALTVAMASAVMPDGKVITYDIRPEHQEVARRNVEAAGLANVVQFRIGDVGEEIEEREVDAVVLDIPEPWTAFENAALALRVGGHVACYMPTTNQLEKAVNELRRLNFAEVEAVELIERSMVVTEGGVRPSFDMLGHTGYICIARWVGERV